MVLDIPLLYGSDGEAHISKSGNLKLGTLINKNYPKYGIISIEKKHTKN